MRAEEIEEATASDRRTGMTRIVNRQKQPVTHIKLVFEIFVIILCSYAATDSGAQSASPPSNPAETDPIAGVSDGTISGNMYHNAELGFRYEFPAGWSVNGKGTQANAIAAGQQFVWADDTPVRRDANAARQCSKNLLLVTRHPEEMRLNEFNSLALLIAADPKCLAGASYPSSVNDQAAIQHVAGNLGTYFKTYSTTSVTPRRVRAFESAGRVMLEVSEGFKVSRHELGTTKIQNIRSSVLIMKAEKHWVMWMFASAIDDEFEKLRASRIFFDAVPH
jgi:hypothetical protein